MVEMMRNNAYKMTKLHVLGNKGMSGTFKVNKGLRQGDSLGPLLYSVYVAIFEDIVKTISIAPI